MSGDHGYCIPGTFRPWRAKDLDRSGWMARASGRPAVIGVVARARSRGSTTAVFVHVLVHLFTVRVTLVVVLVVLYRVTQSKVACSLTPEEFCESTTPWTV